MTVTPVFPGELLNGAENSVEKKILYVITEGSEKRVVSRKI